MQNQEIKAFANLAMYTDTRPFEVIEVRTANKVIIREMKAEMSADWKPEIVAGGFGGHCVNNHDQDSAWVITPDEEGREITIRYSKAKGRWQDKYGQRFYMADEPFKHHDFNF